MKCVHCGAGIDPGSQFCSRCGRPAGDKITHRDGDEKSVHAVRLDEVLSGRYRLKARLGEGGMGTVFLAHDKELDREVAVKLLAAPLVNDPEVVERFEREAKLTAKLDHPNVVPVYDVGRHEGRPYMVMKNLAGGTLAALLREKGGLSADETLKLLRQLSAGLDFIHSKGFIHRDIKAGNIFVGPEGQATLLDFGILRPSRAGEGMTKTGVVMGTPHYMAPEQAMGSKQVDHRVDIYALAVVLFECLTGTLPFEADSELRLIQMQAHSPPPDILERAPWIAKPVAEVMKRALAKRPEDRFSTGGEMVKALEHAYAASKTMAVPQAAAPPSVPYKGPPQAPGTAPSWRRKSGDSVPVVPTPRPLRPIIPTPIAPRLAPPQQAGSKGRGGTLLFALLAAAAVTLVVALKPWQTPIIVAAPDAGAPAALASAADAKVEPDVTDAGELAVSNAPDSGSSAAVDSTPDAGAAAAIDAATDAGKRPLQVARRGSVNIISVHDGEMFWGQVFLDGIEKGRTPLTLDLMPGRYQLRVERHGFRTQERQIVVASGKSIVERFDLIP